MLGQCHIIILLFSAVAGLISSGQLWQSVLFLLKYPEASSSMLVLSLSATAGVMSSTSGA
jgi:hypothetical protein